MRPVLSWKNRFRSPLEETIAARDVSFRMYRGECVMFGCGVIFGFDGADGL